MARVDAHARQYRDVEEGGTQPEDFRRVVAVGYPGELVTSRMDRGEVEQAGNDQESRRAEQPQITAHSRRPAWPRQGRVYGLNNQHDREEVVGICGGDAGDQPPELRAATGGALKLHVEEERGCRADQRQRIGSRIGGAEDEALVQGKRRERRESESTVLEYAERQQVAQTHQRNAEDDGGEPKRQGSRPECVRAGPRNQVVERRLALDGERAPPDLDPAFAGDYPRGAVLVDPHLATGCIVDPQDRTRHEQSERDGEVDAGLVAPRGVARQRCAHIHSRV